MKVGSGSASMWCGSTSLDLSNAKRQRLAFIGWVHDKELYLWKFMKNHEIVTLKLMVKPSTGLTTWDWVIISPSNRIICLIFSSFLINQADSVARLSFCENFCSCSKGKTQCTYVRITLSSNVTELFIVAELFSFAIWQLRMVRITSPPEKVPKEKAGS